MTFHRFIEDKILSIVWGSQAITPWNPFCQDESKRQTFPDDHLPGNVIMKGFVLPHKANFSTERAYSIAEGPKGWSGQQGFYVYRGKRLLLAGDWLGLFRKEEHYKLARIMIDLPNSQDAEWQIDIKKSKAFPPAECRNKLNNTQNKYVLLRSKYSATEVKFSSNELEPNFILYGSKRRKIIIGRM